MKKLEHILFTSPVPLSTPTSTSKNNKHQFEKWWFSKYQVTRKERVTIISMLEGAGVFYLVDGTMSKILHQLSKAPFPFLHSGHNSIYFIELLWRFSEICHFKSRMHKLWDLCILRFCSWGFNQLHIVYYVVRTTIAVSILTMYRLSCPCHYSLNNTVWQLST
jgi:hypothetical protein